uniref:Uncharacterized protein n=1 Tax=Physcomitrium patens TaxID=3218 RepID=A0A2K1L7Z3_PHYPA|nr:hypothetical protein PHYPA_000577 [Physcomitrium patens]
MPLSPLSRSEWYVLAPGYHGGPTRLDVLLTCWNTKSELRSLATKAAIIAEAFGRSRWLLLVVGRKFKPNSGTNCCRFFWTQSPRCPSFPVVRFNGSRIYFLSFTPDDLEIFVNYHQTRAHTIDEIAALVTVSCNLTPARGASRDEAPEKVQQSATIGRHVTSFQLEEVVCPYVSLEKRTGQYTTSRHTNVTIAKWMYMMVHLNVAVAVGLMARLPDEHWQYGCLRCALLSVSWVRKLWLQPVMTYGWFFQE